MKKHIEIITIEHKGVGTTIKINYDKAQVSLIHRKNREGLNTKNWVDKDYTFVGREILNINGWMDVLDSMRFAMEEGKKRLEQDLAEKSRFKEDFVIGVAKGLLK